MAEGVRAMQAAEVIGGRTFWKAIGVTGRYLEGIQHPQPVFQIRDSVGQICRNSRWQLVVCRRAVRTRALEASRTPEPLAPHRPRESYSLQAAAKALAHGAHDRLLL